MIMYSGVGIMLWPRFALHPHDKISWLAILSFRFYGWPLWIGWKDLMFWKGLLDWYHKLLGDFIVPNRLAKRRRRGVRTSYNICVRANSSRVALAYFRPRRHNEREQGCNVQTDRPAYRILRLCVPRIWTGLLYECEALNSHHGAYQSGNQACWPGTVQNVVQFQHYSVAVPRCFRSYLSHFPEGIVTNRYDRHTNSRYSGYTADAGAFHWGGCYSHVRSHIFYVYIILNSV